MSQPDAARANDPGLLDEIRGEAHRLRLVSGPEIPSGNGASAFGPDWLLVESSLAMAARQLAREPPPAPPRSLKALVKHLVRRFWRPVLERMAFPQRQFNFYLLQSARASAAGLRLLETRLDRLEGRVRGLP